jgi:hypothetical protein
MQYCEHTNKKKKRDSTPQNEDEEKKITKKDSVDCATQLQQTARESEKKKGWELIHTAKRAFPAFYIRTSRFLACVCVCVRDR